MKLVEGHWYKINDSYFGQHIGQYIGRQKHFPCCICGKGCNAHTFNVYYGEEEGEYETWGYGNEHLDVIEEVSQDANTIINDKGGDGK